MRRYTTVISAALSAVLVTLSTHTGVGSVTMLAAGVCESFTWWSFVMLDHEWLWRVRLVAESISQWMKDKADGSG